ncbi:hypothetical protein CCACVL1_02776 [Corchorus capsularis]|uniref:Retrotransposon gag protein n=1 Tax=Corchorus capsularis TaxID=210143 RepID=A0A1R3K5Y5_COCAP|nr:hypothetical protein CCACVL1_02776 [Corchorus capsularis]
MDKFKTVRSEILSMDPLLAINRAYAMLITEEKQLSIGSSRVPIEAAAFAVKPGQKPSPKVNQSSQQTRVINEEESDKPICGHCVSPHGYHNAVDPHVRSKRKLNSKLDIAWNCKGTTSKLQRIMPSSYRMLTVAVCTEIIENNSGENNNNSRHEAKSIATSFQASDLAHDMSGSHLPTISETSEMFEVENLVKNQVEGMKTAIMDDIKDIFDQLMVRREKAREKNSSEVPSSPLKQNQTPLPPLHPYYSFIPPPYQARSEPPPWPSNSGQASDTSQQIQWSNPYYQPSYRMDLPRFNGEDFKSWFSKFEQYLEMENVPDEYKPKVAMFPFEGPALHWHQFYAGTVGGMGNVRW